jgi:hypothetical protein
MGGHYVQQTTAFFPLWIHVIEFIIVFGGFLGALLIVILRAFKRRETEWEPPKSEDQQNFWERLFS